MKSHSITQPIKKHILYYLYLRKKAAVVKVRIPVGFYFLSVVYSLQISHQQASIYPFCKGVNSCVSTYIARGQPCVFYTKLSFSPHSTDLFIIHKTRAQATHLKSRQYCWSETGWISTAVPLESPDAHRTHTVEF